MPAEVVQILKQHESKGGGFSNAGWLCPLLAIDAACARRTLMPSDAHARACLVAGPKDGVYNVQAAAVTFILKCKSCTAWGCPKKMKVVVSNIFKTITVFDAAGWGQPRSLLSPLPPSPLTLTSPSHSRAPPHPPARPHAALHAPRAAPHPRAPMLGCLRAQMGPQARGHLPAEARHAAAAQGGHLGGAGVGAPHEEEVSACALHALRPALTLRALQRMRRAPARMRRVGWGARY